MIRFDIGVQYRKDHNITSEWIAKQFRKHDGSSAPCIRASFEGNGANIAFGAGDCPNSTGPPKRHYSRRDKALREAWRKHKVSQNPTVGTLSSFQEEAFRIMGMR